MAGHEAAGRTTRRADAEANRARILKAAHAALEESGDASMQSIAKRAGIGQGTLYRHFPTREALVLEVHRRDVTALVNAAPRLLKDHPPRAALREWLDRLAQYGIIKRGLAGAFQAATHQQLAEEGYAPVISAINLLLQAGQQDGSIRADIDGTELLLLVGFLWNPDADADREARMRHMLDIVLDALRVPACAATGQNDSQEGPRPLADRAPVPSHPHPESQHDEGAQEHDDADDEQVEQPVDDLADDAEGHGH